MYQEKYWLELTHIKIYILYLSEYAKRYEKLNILINSLLAISSNSCICGWVIWKSYGFIWAFIIAISQLINAIKYLFPFEKNIKKIMNLKNELEKLFLLAEEKWFDVSEGELSNKKIHELTLNLKREKIKSEQRFFNIKILPENKKLFKKAQSQAKQYFDSTYLQEN